MSTAKIELAPKLIPIFVKENLRYLSSWGGRGSSKTRAFAMMTAIKGYEWAEQGISGVILSGREKLNSLAESSMEEIKQVIKSVPWLADYYELGEQYIRTKNRLISYVFAGLSQNLDSIKSKARILLCWIDEAETVSEIAWQKLLPTVREEFTLADGRKQLSQIWITWNPEKKDSATSKRFRHEFIYDEDTGELIGMGVEMNYRDNPWFPHVLDLERRQDKRKLDAATYEWIWEGAYKVFSDAQIFRGKYEVLEFTANEQKWDGPYFGLDYGFANDPTACTKKWIYNDCLYIEYDAGSVGLDIDDTPKFLIAKIPDIAKFKVVADNSRPESTSYLKRNGMPYVESCVKGKGSVEDGIEFIKSFDKVYIHPRCKETKAEFDNYSYKVDRLTNEVLPIIIDKFNHYIDSIRYGLEPIMKGNVTMWDAMQ